MVKMNRVKAQRKKQKKIKKEKEIIQEYLNNGGRDTISYLIDMQISNDYKGFLTPNDLLELLLKEDKFEIARKLNELREEALFIATLQKSGFIGLYQEINNTNEKTAYMKLRNYFLNNEFNEGKGVLKEYSRVEDSFNKAKKMAEKKYKTALNKMLKEDKEKGLLETIQVAPWGSVISLRAIRTLILIKAYEKKGKTFSSLRKEIINRPTAQKK